MMIILVAPLLLAASPANAAPPDQCGASKVRALAGKRGTPARMEIIRKRSGAETMRVTRPGQAVTADYRLTRLNVELNEKGVIKRLTCG